MVSPNEIINPGERAPPVGYSHAIATRGGRIVWLAGQNGTDRDGRIVAPGDVVAQLDLALGNLLTALAAAGGRPEHVVQLRLYVWDVQNYRDARPALGTVWRRHFGRHYPAMSVVGVDGFFDPAALAEVDGVAVVPDPSTVPPADLA